MEHSIILMLQKYLTHLHIPNQIFKTPVSEAYEFDLGLRSILYEDINYSILFQKIIEDFHEKELYFLRDFSEVYYSLFWISADTFLWIGPYALKDYDRSHISQLLQQLNLSSQYQPYFHDYHNIIPTVTGAGHFDMLLISAMEQLCPNNIFSYEYVPLPLPATLATKDFSSFEYNFFEDLQIIELRYEYMKQLMDSVKAANTEKALETLSQFLSLTGPNRLSNHIKNNSYYLSIFNVTLRNVAWDSHVHPYYLDKISKHFSLRIDKISSKTDKEGLMRSMIRHYSNLIRNHAKSQYSASIQRVLLLIDYDLSADLSLSSIASQLNVNASYLSSLFKKETDTTLTEYVNKHRIEKAIYFLNSGDLQIQVIGQLVGIYDLAYFTRLFKKYNGLSPSQYRKSLYQKIN